MTSLGEGGVADPIEIRSRVEVTLLIEMVVDK